jgi:hypothetical protein
MYTYMYLQISSTVASSSTQLIIVSANNSNVVGQALHINPTANGPVQFDNSSSGTSTGFNFFGDTVFWVSSSGSWESSFFAKPADASGSFQIVWYANPSSGDNVLPIKLQRTPPGNHSADGPQTAT